jgi:hypothetical protein
LHKAGLPLLGHEDPRVRRRPAALLGEFSPATLERAAPALTGGLKDSDGAVRGRSALVLYSKFKGRALHPLAAGIGPGALARRHAAGEGYEQLADFLLGFLLQPGEGEADAARTLLTAFLSRGNPRGAVLDRRLRAAAHAVSLMPLYLLAGELVPRAEWLRPSVC